jgi:predicted nucleic acid binding AN1-type Zn finger protein
LCGAKLNLADQTIGLCKCELVFCKDHRLPESHACAYNFKRIVLPEAMKPQKVVKI